MRITNIYTPKGNFNNTQNKKALNQKKAHSQINFTRRYLDNDSLDLFPNDISARLEKAFKEFMQGKYTRPSFKETVKENGNKIVTYFQKDGKTPDYNIEFSPSNETLRTTYFDIDGKTKLMEYIKGENGIKKTVYYGASSGNVINEHIFKK